MSLCSSKEQLLVFACLSLLCWGWGEGGEQFALCPSPLLWIQDTLFIFQSVWFLYLLLGLIDNYMQNQEL